MFTSKSTKTKAINLSLLLGLVAAILGAAPAHAATISCTGGTYTVTNGVASDGNSCTGALVLDLSVTSIALSGFSDATLTSLICDPALTSIPVYGFTHSPLTSLTLNPNLQSIGNYAFTDAQLTSLVLNPELQSIGSYAFSSSPLTTLTLNQSLVTIGRNAFHSAQLTSLHLDDALKDIGESAFDQSAINTLTLDAALTTIGLAAFGSATITSLVLGDHVTSVGAAAFLSAPLTSLTLDSRLSTIGNAAFNAAVLTCFTNLSSASLVSTGLESFTSLPTCSPVHHPSNQIASPPAPDQRSAITSIVVETGTIGTPLKVEVKGSFIEPLTNIEVAGDLLPSGSWTQTSDHIIFLVSEKVAGRYQVQLYNGSFPLMAVQEISFAPGQLVVPSVKKIHYLQCVKGGHRRVAYGINPICPKGYFAQSN